MFQEILQGGSGGSGNKFELIAEATTTDGITIDKSRLNGYNYYMLEHWSNNNQKFSNVIFTLDEVVPNSNSPFLYSWTNANGVSTCSYIQDKGDETIFFAPNTAGYVAKLKGVK